MDDLNMTHHLEVFCPHCDEAVAIAFTRPIPAQHVTVIPKSGRIIENTPPS